MPHALLPTWANNPDGWCRTITDDILKNRVTPSDQDIDRYLKLLLAEKKLSSETFNPVPKIEETDLDANPLDAVRLDSLKVGEGVNALQKGAQIDFAPAVTVIFGENGAGKSGFVRVMKRAAGVRTADDILPNVRSANRPSATARFTVTVGTTPQPVEWKNDFGIAPLNRVSIFDARGARVHAEEDLTYVYTPGELMLFPLVQDTIDRVRVAFEAAIAARTPGANAILPSFDRTCSIYPIIETLGAATDLNELRSYAVVPEDIDVLLERLRIEVDALRSTTIQNELKRARDRLAVVKTLKSAVESAKSFDIATYNAHRDARDRASQRRAEAGNKAFERLEVAGILGGEWRRFIQADEEYLRTHAAATYPAANDPCVYCQQPLVASGLELVRSIASSRTTKSKKHSMMPSANFRTMQRALRTYTVTHWNSNYRLRRTVVPTSSTTSKRLPMKHSFPVPSARRPRESVCGISFSYGTCPVRFGSTFPRPGYGREWPFFPKADARGMLNEGPGIANTGHCIRPLAKHPL